MILNELHIHNFRNIKSLRLNLHPQFNYIIGPNGSGKTSILESVYVLSCAHSFRSREIQHIIRKGAQEMTVFARSVDTDQVSVMKRLDKSTLVKWNSDYLKASSQLAQLIPVQVFYQDIFQIIDAGPSVRRSLLDWGMFHVKHEYLNLIKDYNKLLKQRNALLKQKASSDKFIVWDKQLSGVSEKVHIERASYFNQWYQVFKELLPRLSPLDCHIKYYKGWDRKSAGLSLERILKENLESDIMRSYTQYGPHHADLVIESDQTKAKSVLSRGQQKMILICLKMSQATLLNSSCIFLFDDLASELDSSHINVLLSYLEKQQQQCIISFTERHKYMYPQGRYFTIADGAIV